MNTRRPLTRAHHRARLARLTRLRHRNIVTPSLDTSILQALGLHATEDTEAFDDAAALAAFCAPLRSERELLERTFGDAP